MDSDEAKFLSSRGIIFAHFSMRSRTLSVHQAVRGKCKEHSPAQSLASWSVHLGLMVEPFNDRQEDACPVYRNAVQSC